MSPLKSFESGKHLLAYHSSIVDLSHTGLEIDIISQISMIYMIVRSTHNDETQVRGHRWDRLAGVVFLVHSVWLFS